MNKFNRMEKEISDLKEERRVMREKMNKMRGKIEEMGNERRTLNIGKENQIYIGRKREREKRELDPRYQDHPREQEKQVKLIGRATEWRWRAREIEDGNM